MKLLHSDDISRIINNNGVLTTLKELVQALKHDFAQWQQFQIAPRHAFHYPNGVIELMPTTTSELYSFKFINGHPANTGRDKLSIVGFGALADTHTGYPLMLAEMTLLTALRTAATSALAASYLAPKNANTMALIGTGAQSEFQTLAMHAHCGIQRFRYFDIDQDAMDKYANNLQQYDIELIPCRSALETITGADIITTATAKKEKVTLLSKDQVPAGVMLNTIGGDCPGKTELDPAILEGNVVVVDFLEQALVEGEIQNVADRSGILELWQLVSGNHPGRSQDDQITVFDSVGCAVEDFSVLRYLHQLTAEQQNSQSAFLAETDNPKNLFGLLKQEVMS